MDLFAPESLQASCEIFSWPTRHAKPELFAFLTMPFVDFRQQDQSFHNVTSLHCFRLRFILALRCVDALAAVLQGSGMWTEIRDSKKCHLGNDVGVSKNRGTPKWLVYKGKP